MDEPSLKNTIIIYQLQNHKYRYHDKKFSQSEIAKKHEYFARKLLFHRQLQSEIGNYNEQIHTGEKPHAYKYCDKKFTESEITKRHEYFPMPTGLSRTKVKKVQLCFNYNHHCYKFYI